LQLEAVEAVRSLDQLYAGDIKTAVRSGWAPEHALMGVNGLLRLLTHAAELCSKVDAKRKIIKRAVTAMLSAQQHAMLEHRLPADEMQAVVIAVADAVGVACESIMMGLAFVATGEDSADGGPLWVGVDISRPISRDEHNMVALWLARVIHAADSSPYRRCLARPDKAMRKVKPFVRSALKTAGDRGLPDAALRFLRTVITKTGSRQFLTVDKRDLVAFLCDAARGALQGDAVETAAVRLSERLRKL
jgi:hypothetical protein